VDTAVPVYSTNHFITSSDVDFASRLKLSAMFGFFQDIAARHAANLGGGVERIRTERGVAWILMRVRVEVAKYPKLHDKINLGTWPQKPRALYERDYVISDESGDALVRAASTWIIMNLKDREIVREKFLDYRGVEIKTERALGRGLAKMKPIEDAEPVFEKMIGYSDVDYNEHINNARYVDYIMDCIPFPEHKSRAIRAVEVNYLNELTPGETIVLRRAAVPETNGRLYVEGVRKTDEQPVFLSVVEF
jgi:acyl-ACP thioesterase